MITDEKLRDLGFTSRTWFDKNFCEDECDTLKFEEHTLPLDTMGASVDVCKGFRRPPDELCAFEHLETVVAIDVYGESMQLNIQDDTDLEAFCVMMKKVAIPLP